MPSGSVRAAILAGALLGALLLLVAEFTTLYEVHRSTSPIPVRTVGTGHNDSYALIPLALLAGALAVGVFRSGSRPALLAIGLVGLVALFIALLGDLPDAHSTGLGGSAARGYFSETSTPSAGFYLETLGAVLLVATCVLGFLALGRPEPRPPDRGTSPPGRGPHPSEPGRSVS